MSDFPSFSLNEIPERELIKALIHQLDGGLMNDTEAGVTRQFLDRGRDSLSGKQFYVFEKQVVPNLTQLCGVNKCRTPILVCYENCEQCGIEYNISS